MSQIKKWWKSARIRSIRRKISDFQILLFPVFKMVIRIWVMIVHRCVTVERRGPLYHFIRSGQPCILALWHQSVFPLMFELFRYTPVYPTLFMVSKGRIGTIGTNLLNMYGIECVSTAEGKKDAVYELAKRANQTGKSVFLMADGSKGPHREAKWGAIYLARETSLPIIGAHAWGDNLILLKRTWMKLVIPKPWGRSTVLSAEPIYIPSDADKDSLEIYRKKLEAQLSAVADALLDHYEQGASLSGWENPQERAF